MTPGSSSDVMSVQRWKLCQRARAWAVHVAPPSQFDTSTVGSK